MTATVAAPTAVPQLRRYALPRLALGRFVGIRTVKAGIVWGLVIGLYTYASAVGFTTLAPTAGQRQKLLDSLAANTGLQALLGDAHHIDTVGGFTDWRAIGVMSLATAIWALLAATRALRGEEAAGRWELFLAGQTTARRATATALAGLATGVVVIWVLVAAITAAVGTKHDIGFSAGDALLFGLAIIAAPLVFLAVGALASQLVATRARAAGLSAVVFGVAFMLRALGDAAPAAHWLVYTTPLGWIEQLHPLAGPRPIWLLPVAALTAVLVAAALLLAGRDLGTSVIADADTAVAHTRFLNSPAGLAWRLSRAAIIGWLTATVLAGLLYGSFTKSAAQAFTSSAAVRKFTGGLTGSPQHQAAATYAGVIFLILMTLIMAYTASAISGVREQEADAYLDNLLVRTVSRLRWLAGRTALIAVVTIAAGVLAGVAFWAGTAAQHTGLTAGELLLAGVNAAAPALLLGGIAVFTLGFWPRATGLAAYGVLAWSFLLEMLGSAISINHWVMDTSLLHHIALAPASNPNWRIIATYLALGVVLAAAGAWRFNRRDLQTE